MKAAIMVEQGCDLVISDVKLNNKLGVGHVLVELDYAGICGSQLAEIDGVKGPNLDLPYLMGHEGVGNVVDIGLGVTRVKVGDRVVLHAIDGEGVKAEPYIYTWGGAVLGTKIVSAFCEMTVASESRVTSVNEGFLDCSLSSVSLMGCAMLSAISCVERVLNPMMGESLVVIGAGGLGNCVVKCGLLRGMRPILVVDRNPSKLCLAKEMGAMTVISEYDKRFGFDYVVVCTHSADALSYGYDLVKEGGLVVFMGVPDVTEVCGLEMMKIHNDTTITGARVGRSEPSVDIPRMVRMTKDLDLDSMVTANVDLEDVNDGINRLRGGDILGRCVVNIR